MTIDELIERAHAMAVSKGWWPEGSDRSVVEQVNNFNGEIAEAWEECRHKRMKLWWSVTGKPDATSYAAGEAEREGVSDALLLDDGYKPEGFWVEIADLVIRLADTAGAYGWPMRPVSCPQFTSEVHLIKVLRSGVNSLECGDGHDAWVWSASVHAATIVSICVDSAKAFGVDLWSLIELKMRYNATREHRHGGLQA